MGIRNMGLTLIVIAILLGAGVLYFSTRERGPLTFSPVQILNATWNDYKREYIDPNSGRTIDKARGNITTSEGQSYTMLRAVWMGDKVTFDRSWSFAKDNLQHVEGDALFAWLYGQRADDTYGILFDRGGNTTASDADSDIALALIFAYSRWQDPEYLDEAREIISDIWEKEVLVIRGVPYLAANNLEKFSTSTTAILNPSYFAPYAYRVFAQVDRQHPWQELVTGSYMALEKSLEQRLDAPGSAQLPPDWVVINKTTGAIEAPRQPGLTTQFGYDALRTPWRIALDAQWSQDQRAQTLLGKMGHFSQEWNTHGVLSTVYGHDGSVIGPYESPAMYGGVIGYFMHADAEVAQKVYESKLVSLYNPDLNGWKERLSYYDDNWTWFGIALYNNLLPNLAAHLPATAFR